MRNAVILLLLTVAALTATPGPAAPRRSAQGCTNGTTVGRVTYYREEVRCNGAAINTRISLRQANILAAVNGGLVKFRLWEKDTRCKTRTGGLVQVRPSTEILISFENGLSYCITRKLGRWKKFDARRHTVTLISDDPLFAVSVERARTLVKVDLGFGVVLGRSGRGTAVGPHEQVIVPEGGDPEAPTPIERTGSDRLSFAELERELPRPRFDRPDPGGSATLRDVFSRGRLIVGLETSISRNPAARRFIGGFIRLVGRAWNVRPEVRNVTVGGAISGLRAEQLDLAVSAHPDVLARSATVPLLVEPRSRVYWHIASRPDPTLAAALRSLVLASMQRDDYFTLYRTAFRR